MLGVDPGVTNVGWALITGREPCKLVASGVWDLRGADGTATHAGMMYALRERLTDISRRFNVGRLALEDNTCLWKKNHKVVASYLIAASICATLWPGARLFLLEPRYWKACVGLRCFKNYQDNKAAALYWAQQHFSYEGGTDHEADAMLLAKAAASFT